MAERELTDRMIGVLFVLAEERENGGYNPALTGNDIALALGFQHGGRRRGSGAAGRGGWSGWMAPANRVIYTVNGLRKRGLVSFSHRPDGMSGTADRITDEGLTELDRLGTDRVREAVERVREEAAAINAEHRGAW